MDLPDMIVRVENLAEIKEVLHNLRAQRVKLEVLINRFEKIVELEGKRA
jgi:hypothetical protein